MEQTTNVARFTSRSLVRERLLAFDCYERGDTIKTLKHKGVPNGAALDVIRVFEAIELVIGPRSFDRLDRKRLPYRLAFRITNGIPLRAAKAVLKGQGQITDGMRITWSLIASENAPRSEIIAFGGYYDKHEPKAYVDGAFLGRTSRRGTPNR